MSADADEWTVLAVGDAPSVRRLGSRVDPDVRVVSGAEAVRDERVEPVLELGAVDRILDRGYNAVHRMRRINRAVRRE